MNYRKQETIVACCILMVKFRLLSQFNLSCTLSSLFGSIKYYKKDSSIMLHHYDFYHYT